MKMFIAILATVLSTSAFADTQLLMGTWKSAKPVVDDPQMRIYLELQLQPTEANISTICQYPDGEMVKATVQSPTSYTADTIEILKAGQNTAGRAVRECSVSITPAKANYRFNNDNSLLLMDQNSNLEFVRQ